MAAFAATQGDRIGIGGSGQNAMRGAIRSFGLMAAIGFGSTAPSGATYVESQQLPYGPEVGMNVTVTSYSGIDTDHADIGLVHSRENAKSFCVSSKNDESDQCVDKTLADVKIQPSILANCSTGRFTNVWGKGFTFVGRAAGGNYLYVIQPDVPDVELDSWANYNVGIEEFKALCPSRVWAADKEDPVPAVGEEAPPAIAEQPAPNDSEETASEVADDAAPDVALEGSSFRGLQLGMTVAQIRQALDPSFAVTSEPKGDDLQSLNTLFEGLAANGSAGTTLYIVKGQRACGEATFRDGQANRFRFYQCYFDIEGRANVDDFARQIIDQYGLDNGMAGSWKMLGDGAYRFKYTEYVGKKSATSERFTVSLHEMNNIVTLTVERIPKANFD